jgi:hypothetical protein
MTATQSIPVEGSIQWAMNRGSLYQVDGIYKYGNLTTGANSHIEAAACVLYRGESYCVWVPNGTVLTVWNVYGGSIGGFCMKDAQRFVVRCGEVFPVIPPANGSLFEASQLPEGLADRLNRVYLSADRKARPWAF